MPYTVFANALSYVAALGPLTISYCSSARKLDTLAPEQCLVHAAVVSSWRSLRSMRGDISRLLLAAPAAMRGTETAHVAQASARRVLNLRAKLNTFHAAGHPAKQKLRGSRFSSLRACALPQPAKREALAALASPETTKVNRPWASLQTRR